MIKFRVYSVYDSKAESFSSPIFLPNDAMAQRSFADSVNSPGSPVGKHPEDYILFLIGEWDAIEGKLSGMAPVSVCNAIQLVEVK